MGKALLLPGRLTLIADHMLVTLKQADRAEPSFLLSWYAVAFAGNAPGGNICFIRAPGTELGEAILTDSQPLDEALRSRFQPRAWELGDPARKAIPATFLRTPLRAGQIEATITTAGLALSVAWRQLSDPIVASGPAGADALREVSTVLFAARNCAVSINGQPVAGEPYDDDAWRSWLDRPLSTALVALAEVFRELPGE